jgi:mannosyltransferase OCH1-like enzyme
VIKKDEKMKYAGNLLRYFVLFGTIHLSALVGHHPLPYAIDFDVSMKTALYPKKVEEAWGRYAMNFFRTLYGHNNPLTIEPYPQPIIEHIIHQIWLGSPFPAEYADWQASWKRHHPTWEYRLWTDEDLATFPLYNRDMYEAAENYGEKSDIARYEILYQYGGLYIDTDVECVAPFDFLHDRYTFYVGIQPLDTASVQLGIGIIGASKHHSLLACAIQQLRNNKNIPQVIAKTGPIFFTQLFCTFVHNFERCIALPSSYFYPRGYNQAYKDRDQWLCPETYAIHHWGGTWLKPEAFVKGKK